MKIKGTWVEIIYLKKFVQSNEMACRKMGRLGLDHVIVVDTVVRDMLLEVCGPQEAQHGLGWATG